MGYETVIGPAVPDAAAAVRTVLVVDDSPSQRFTLSRTLRRSGYRVIEAGSGQEALRVCESDPPDLVLSDWMMPGMDGLAFCREFRRMKRVSYGYFILLTSKSDKKDITRGFDAGADDFLTKPVNASELRARITACERVLRVEMELTRKNRIVNDTLKELQRVHAMIEQDLRQARKIQQSLLPERQKTFGGTSVSFLLRPCGHVGGDLVGAFHPGHDRLGFYSIDVSGHGISSALMTARLASYLNDRYLDQNIALERRFDQFHALRPPEEVMRALNAHLLAGAEIDQYFTMCYGTMDMQSGCVKMVQAGHPPPVLLRREGRIEFVGNGGLPVGLLENAQWTSLELRLCKGDRLLFYSDGITECSGESGEMIGEDGLLRLLGKADGRRGPEMLDGLFRQLTDRCPQARLEDDVSALLVEYDGPE